MMEEQGESFHQDIKTRT